MSEAIGAMGDGLAVLLAVGECALGLVVAALMLPVVGFAILRGR
jgi:hypothetical protein